MGVRSTNPSQSFIDDFYRSGTDAATAAPPGAPIVAELVEQQLQPMDISITSSLIQPLIIL